jgi:hypothetical protein
MAGSTLIRHAAVFDGNPVNDITALRDITTIWRRGIPVDRSARISEEKLV